MARTTLDLDPAVLDELRSRAQREHKTMGQVASEALVRALREEGATYPGLEALGWIARDLGTPKVDLEDEEAVRRALDDGA